MTERILFVDDEPRVLDGLRRLLRRDFEIDTAVGAREGLRSLGEHDYAVIVSDMMMPEIPGPEFLALAARRSPDAVQLILSGQADLTSTVSAVNRGNIFRFLVKPASREDLSAALTAALKQYRLRTVERELLEQTLSGAVDALGELLVLASPQSARRSGLVRQFARRIAEPLGLADDWQLSMAVTLASVGLLTVADEVLDRHAHQEDLDPAEIAMIRQHPAVAARIIDRIPRLDGIAEIVREQASRNRSKVRSDLQPHAEVLQLATELADRVLRGASIDEALHEAEFSGRFHRETFAGMWAAPAGTRRESLTVPELEVGMTLCEDLRTTKGTVVVPSGTMLTPTLLERIVNFSTGVGVVEPIDVEIADDTPAEALAS